MSEQINELAAALAKAQAELRAVPKGKTAKVESKRTGTSYSYKYADLADAFDVCRLPLANHGLSIVQAPVSPDRGVICISTMLLHSSGQWMRSNLAMEATDTTPQSIGTIITYGRRYGLAAMIGLVTDDDTDAQGHEGDRPAAQRTNGSASYNPATRAEAPPRVPREARPPAQAAQGASERDRLLGALRAAYAEARSAGADVTPPGRDEVAGWSDEMVRQVIATFRAATSEAAARRQAELDAIDAAVAK